MLPFNRTFEALKCVDVMEVGVQSDAFNRTFEALKLSSANVTGHERRSFNRTFEALKLPCRPLKRTPITPLIAPLRH